jgi:hypothetical protein
MKAVAVVQDGIAVMPFSFLFVPAPGPRRFAQPGVQS